MCYQHAYYTYNLSKITRRQKARARRVGAAQSDCTVVSSSLHERDELSASWILLYSQVLWKDDVVAVEEGSVEGVLKLNSSTLMVGIVF